MDARKYFPFFRKALIAALSFWGYFVVRIFTVAVVTAIYTDSDTMFVGLHPSYGIACALASIIVLFIYAFDSYACDTVYCLNYLDEIDPEAENFIFKDEFKRLLKTKTFFVGIGIWAFFSLITWSFLEMLACVFINVICELFARRQWFNGREHRDLVKRSKRPYALTLVGHTLLWFALFFGMILCVGALKMSLGSIIGLVAYVLSIVLCAVAVLLVVLFFYRRIRAIRIQKRLMNKLEKLSRANGLRFRKPQNIYSTVLLQKVSCFTLEHKHLSFNCVLIPTISRKTPLYFIGNGIVKRVRTFYFFKIELFKRERVITYKLKKPAENERNIILLSPIPRAFYLGPVGNPTEGDNSSEIDNALIYSGSAFCNYAERLLSQEHIYEKEAINH